MKDRVDVPLVTEADAHELSSRCHVPDLELPVCVAGDEERAVRMKVHLWHVRLSRLRLELALSVLLDQLVGADLVEPDVSASKASNPPSIRAETDRAVTHLALPDRFEGWCGCE